MIQKEYILSKSREGRRESTRCKVRRRKKKSRGEGRSQKGRGK
jgi:hypothetical protein